MKFMDNAVIVTPFGQSHPVVKVMITTPFCGFEPYRDLAEPF